VRAIFLQMYALINWSTKEMNITLIKDAELNAWYQFTQ
jgi:hypothetical protein